MSLDENLNRVLSRYDELQALMSAEEAPAADEIARLSKEFSDLMAPPCPGPTRDRQGKAPTCATEPPRCLPPVQPYRVRNVPHQGHGARKGVTGYLRRVLANGRHPSGVR